MNIDRIEEIFRYSYRKYDDLYEHFLNYADFQILSTNLTLGYDTLRIRDYDDLDKIKSRDDVKYPPESKSFSRIGKPNQIWFYVSDNFNASASEMLPGWYSKVKHGDDIKIIISKWHVREMIRVVIIPDFNNQNAVCRLLDLSSYHRDKKFWEYIGSKFRLTTLQNKDIYQFTSAFSNAIMDRAKLDDFVLEGIFYPSVQYPFQSNLALCKETVDEEKILLKSLYKTVIHKSLILNEYGLPNYKQICDFEQGFYDPYKDKIQWN